MPTTFAKRLCMVTGFLAVLSTLQGCGGGDDSAPAVSTYPVGTQNCDAVDQLALTATRITLKQSVPAGLVAPSTAASGTPPAIPVPDHCHVQGKINERTGTDGKSYAIGFDLRLPKVWNGR